ncbi:MAG TPA: SDR family oxidoreductase [Gaiellaceae bacterium]
MPAVLVTGVSRLGGIASAVARTLAREGWTVAGTGFRPFDETEPWGAEPDAPARLLEEGALAAWSENDLADPEAPARVVTAAEAAVGPLTALVVLHTESRLGGILDTSAADFDRHLAVNARATLLLIAEFARRFRGESGSGRIVAFTTGAVHGEVAYGASKKALERIVVASAAELGPRGITVNAVDPGPTDTGWLSEDLAERISAATPLRRIGRPEDAAELVAFLCSPRGGWITGQLLVSDGGVGVAPALRRGREPPE